MAHALTKTMSKHHDPDTDTLIAHTLRASGFDASEDGTGRGTPLVESFWPQSAGDMRGIEPRAGDVGALHKKQTPALLTMREGKDGGGKGPLISEDQSLTLATGNGQTLFASSVRRLTPTECERLQGFPDGWTCLCDQSPCVCPDGPRYAAIGNAVTEEEMRQRDILLDIIDELVCDLSMIAADDGWKSLKSVVRAQGVSKTALGFADLNSPEPK